MNRALRSLSFAVPVVVAGHAATARADSGRLHLHADFGFGGAAVGDASFQRFGDERSLGGAVSLGLDYQFRPPYSVEFTVLVGGFSKPFDNSGLTSAPLGSLTMGMRFRLFDDDRGYAGERGGSLRGNLYIAPHIGWYSFDSAQYGADVAIGYEFSVRRPFSIGPMVRVLALAGGATSGPDMIFLAGFGTSFEVIDPPSGNDADGDGLSAAEEAEHHTNPRLRDTDGDGISDRVEVDEHTDPTSADTDGDGLADGYEDENGNGLLDLDETDPRNFDTDGGGISDGDEVFTYHTDPRNPADDDHDSDGVPNYADHCHATPGGTPVDRTGCQPVVVEVEAISVGFVAGRMRINAEGGEVLNRLAATLTAGSTELVVYVSPTGDTAADGQRAQRRADAIGTYLAQHGVSRDRFRLRAAGADPTADRTTDADVARIEVVRP